MELTNFITATLAPAVAMSTSAILATGLQNRYSEIVSRVRSLNEERRDLGSRPALNALEGDRFFSLDRQIHLFMRRARHVRDAVMLMYAALLAFLSTSMTIAFISEQRAWTLQLIPKVTFFAGMVLVACAVLLEVWEMRLAYSIVRYEVGVASRRLDRQDVIYE